MDGNPLAHYAWLTVAMILTGAGLPIPEEAFIITAGILAVQGTLNPLLAMSCLLFGAIVGDCVMYAIGYHFGHGLLRERSWWARLITPQREQQIEVKFQRHGLKVFFVARFLVGLRSPVYLTAGILRLSFKRFVMIDLICAAAVVGTFFWLTYFVGQQVPQLIHQVQVLLSIAAGIAVACVGFYLWQRHRRKVARLQESICHQPKRPVE